jgi:hypothetical protein
MKIEILGTGCYNCLKLETLIAEVLEDLGRNEDEIIRVDDEKSIKKYIPLDLIPGLVINGRLVSSKSLPDQETLRKWLGEANN